MKKIENAVEVGIYDNCFQVAKIYENRTLVTLPYVTWVGNTGGYAERKIRITGTAHDEIVAAVDDGAEDTAWEIINAYDAGEYRAPAGRPSEMDGGRRVNTYLDAESLAIASRIGAGNVSDGIRQALKLADESNPTAP